ncbi:HTH domain-containing protein [Virgibacillus pantothenticus]|nr:MULTISPECIES: HTH domain-containing protein [Virgibacillus]MBS7430571.1 HTH domain-containing protein [Virgibacillus sp. 19R1-5]MBU8566510.1 HTH domain-containing protein [Virgibacillus pantothenticus]MBU8600075.1 HTH domain-containing protein [Virgibacillus pantothenticus]MBU8633993.1 HTH domain-containing protein [Virgibacillus pantothenticus]MBU8641986.1 HTH domain-containing protein [Virgibacillus pantothenticus]
MKRKVISMFTDRQKEIIELIIKNPNGIFGAKLADKLNVSTRTVRNDIASINKALNVEACRILSSNKKGYYLLPKDMESITAFLNPVTNVQHQGYRNQEQRLYTILGKVLFQEEQDCFDLADELYVSEQTVFKDISKLKHLLETKYKIGSIAIVHNQIHFTAVEEEVRYLLFKMLKELILSDKPDYLTDVSFLVNGHFDEKELELLKIKMKNYLASQKLVVDDKSFEMMVGAIYLTVIRNRSGYTIHSDAQSFFNRDVSSLLQELIKSGVDIKEKDKTSLNRFFWSLKIPSSSASIEENISITALTILNEFRREVLDKYSIDLKESVETMENLKVHIEYMLRRLDTNYELSNPIISDIKKRYPFAYEVAMLVVHIVYRYQKKYLADDEISYIAIYIEIFLRKNNIRLKTVVISDTSMGINDIIQNWLANNFRNHIDVTACLPLIALERYAENHQVDLIIATNILNIEQTIPCHVIERIPERSDYYSLTNTIHKIKNSNRYEKLILRMFSKEFVEIYEDAQLTFEELIEDMAQKLKQYHRINDLEGYVKDVIQREENYPTTIGKHFMIPHPLSSFANKTTVHVAVLKKPLYHNGEKIKMVFLLAIENKMDDDVSTLFQFIQQLALDKDSISSLLEVDGKEAFLKKIIALSTSFFNKHYIE